MKETMEIFPEKNSQKFVVTSRMQLSSTPPKHFEEPPKFFESNCEKVQKKKVF